MKTSEQTRVVKVILERIVWQKDFQPICLYVQTKQKYIYVHLYLKYVDFYNEIIFSTHMTAVEIQMIATCVAYRYFILKLEYKI